jgi:hypothetical protein
MEKGFQKLLKKILLEKYPMYLDVHVTHNINPVRHECYEVFLFVFIEDRDMSSREQDDEVKEYIKNLAKYMGIRICGVWHEAVNEEEWEEMKLRIED